MADQNFADGFVPARAQSRLAFNFA